MQKLTRLPDDISINRCPVFQVLADGSLCDRDIAVETKLENGALTVWLTAEKTPVSEVKLRWRGVIREGGAFLADHWERGYGDLQFRRKADGRPLPWYFLHQREDSRALYGVKVRPSAICWWEVQGADLLLHLDTRSGGYGVELNGRRLEAAKVVWEQSEERPFSALREFLQTLCTDSIYENAGGMLILGCNCIGHLGAGLMHANRTGDDTSGICCAPPLTAASPTSTWPTTTARPTARRSAISAG